MGTHMDGDTHGIPYCIWIGAGGFLRFRFCITRSGFVILHFHVWAGIAVEYYYGQEGTSPFCRTPSLWVGIITGAGWHLSFQYRLLLLLLLLESLLTQLTEEEANLGFYVYANTHNFWNCRFKNRPQSQAYETS
jgi:hypothetical protein